VKTPARDGKITAVVPIFECADRLAAHLTFLKGARPVVSEFVWVVTPGRDESQRLAQEAHRELGGKYLEVPPGLYDAWNAGIRAVATEFTYISTVGESASALGLDRLRTTLQTLGADVAFSPPLLPTQSQARRQLLRWPIFRFQGELKEREGKILSSFLVAKIQAVAGIFSLLGSCASCLFRTAYLQNHPFPSDYYHYGDSAWVYQNYRQAKFVYLKKPWASFSVHGPSGRIVGARDVERLRFIILQDLKKIPQAGRAARALTSLLTATRYLDKNRGRRPIKMWWLNPKLLIARCRRVHAESDYLKWMSLLEQPKQ